MTKPLSPTQAQILSAAACDPARLAETPAGLPAAARNSVFQSLLRAGLLEQAPAAEPGGATVFHITAAGLQAVRAAPDAAEVPDVAQGAEEVPAIPAPAQSRLPLRVAATALLVAWDEGVERPALPASIEALRAALMRGGAVRPPRDPATPRTAREGTKQQAVLTLLRRQEGATIAQVMEATGWAQHTVRGFLAGLKKKGHAVEVLERVRQLGPGSQGAKGSYSVYRIAAGEQG